MRNAVIRKGVKFYSNSDLSVGSSLLRAEIVLDSFDVNDEFTDINELIELFNIKIYLDHDLRSPKWSNEKYVDYCQKVKEFDPILGRFFSSINESNFLQILDEVDIDYIDDFWFLINRHKVFPRISENLIKEIVQSDAFQMSAMLKQKPIVKHFGGIIAKALLLRSDSAELLLSTQIKRIGEKERALYFPAELDKESMNQILTNYIESRDPNPNYLALISESTRCANLKIEDKTRLEAKRKHELCVESLFSSELGSGNLSLTQIVTFSDTQIEEKQYHMENEHKCVLSYSSEWIKKNLDYATLMNNFIYLFEYVDGLFRSQFVSQPSETSILERLVGLKGETCYDQNFQYQIRHSFYCMQMQAYRRELAKYGIRLEDVFQWFFEIYLLEEFNVSGFTYRAPTVGITPLEECKLLAIDMDSILKQYSLYVNEGFIDRELFEISSEQTRVQTLPSLLQEKYIYPRSNECIYMMHLLFSDQSGLTYLRDTEQIFDSFADCISSIPTSFEMFADYQKPKIEMLTSNGCLQIDVEGMIFPNKAKIEILRDLYNNQVSCLHYLNRYKFQIKDMLAKGWICIASSLFSKPEQSYLNFVLNRLEYSNGLDLRNKYVHGSHSLDEGDHRRDYIELLKIMVLIIIKVNEEFCLCENLA